jgi:cell division septation protein DedD
MAAFAVAGIGAVALASPPASAGDGFTVTPTSGPAGTVIAVSGTGCYEEGLPDRHVSIILTDGEQASASSSVVPEDNGAWSGQLTVPAGADPAATYEVYASCWGSILGDNGQEIVSYGPVAFDVTGGGTQPTTPTTATPTTQPPTETTDPTAPDGPETPPPATPVVRPPDQTG